MRLNQITSHILTQLLGWLMWRLLAVALIGLFALVALYQATVAGTIALETQVGALYAHLIVAGAFAGGALITLGIFAATRAKPLPKPQSGALADARNMQIAALVEAAMLGYTLARKQH